MKSIFTILALISLVACAQPKDNGGNGKPLDPSHNQQEK